MRRQRREKVPRHRPQALAAPGRAVIRPPGGRFRRHLAIYRGSPYLCAIGLSVLPCGCHILWITIIRMRARLSGEFAFEPSPIVRALLASAALAAAVALAGCEPTASPPTAARCAPLSDKMRRRAPSQEHGQGVADPRPPVQGRVGARGLEAGSRRPIRAAEDLSDLPLVGRSRAEEQGRRPPGARRASTPSPRADESAIPITISPSIPAIRTPIDRAWGCTGSELMVHGDCSSRGCYAMTDEQIQEIYALAREVVLRRAERLPVAGLPVPHDRAEHGQAPQQSELRVLEDAEGRLRQFRSHPSGAEGRGLREALRVRRGGAGERVEAAAFNPRAQVPGLPARPAIADAVLDHRRQEQVSDGRATSRDGVDTVPLRMSASTAA